MLMCLCQYLFLSCCILRFFFFNDTATTEIYTLSLHDALPILGYHFIKGLLPRHWYQFADDAAIVTAMESNNQILLNKFSRWCIWCDMLIRVDKCYSFGIRKENNRSQQFKPMLFINNLLVKAIDIGQSFVYLGKHFDFEMKLFLQ